MPARLLPLLLVLFASSAFAAPVVYHSPGDDGVDPGLPVSVSEPTDSLFLYVDAGPLVSGAGTPCFDGNGDELCAFRFCLETSDFVSVASFDPDPARDLVWTASLSQLCATGGDAVTGELGPIRIGEVVLGVAGSGMAEIVEGKGVGAGLSLEDVPPRVLALPEPSRAWQLGAGLVFLLALGRLRRESKAGARRDLRPVLGALLAALLVSAGTPARAQDADGDTVPDAIDNCPETANPLQEDVGGTGSAGPDGIGDACQCGDLNGDGRADLLDAAIYERDLAGLMPEATDPNKCSVVGGRLDCEPNDRQALREELVGIAPGVSQVCEAAVAMPPLPANLAASGDSITRGFSATCTCNEGLGCLLLLLFCATEQEDYSWFDGSQIASFHDGYADPSIGSDLSASMSGAEMVDDTLMAPNFAEQADAILAQTPLPDLVTVELGGNDICNRDCVDPMNCGNHLYTDQEWTDAVRAGLDKLVGFSGPGALPLGATIYLLGVPRVQDLRGAGVAKQEGPGDIDCESFWANPPGGVDPICTIGTLAAPLNGEDLLTERLPGIAERVQRYNEILRDEALAYTTNSNGRNLLGIEVVADYVNETTDSVGTTPFTDSEINGGDCFHPNQNGQEMLAGAAWNGNPRPPSGP
jgi:lysophospholipase L1-like esterase